MYGLALGRAGAEQPNSIQNAALGILRRYGTNAHVYLPGANGVAVSGLNSGNYVESTFNTLASVDSVVGGVRDPVGSIDATQSTTANKPALRRGVYNLALYSQDFNGASWARNFGGAGSAPVVTPNYATDPYGGNNATRVQFNRGGNAGGDFSRLIQIVSPGVPCTQYWYVKTTDGSTKQITIRDGTSNQFLRTVDGNWKIIVGTSTTNNAEQSLMSYGTTGGDIAVDLLIYRSGLSAGTLTSAQILAEGGIPLTLAAAASNSGAGRYSFSLNGTTQSLVTASAPFNQNDDWFMGVAFRVDEVAGARVALHAFADATSKGPSLLTSATQGYAALQLYDGTTWGVILGNVGCLGQVVVLHATQVSGVRKLWRNGVLVGTDSTVLTPVTCTGLRIGGSGSAGGSLMNGMVGQSMAHKGTFSDADALTLARMVASNTPAAPTF